MKKKVFFRFFFQFFDAFLEILKSIYSKNRKLSQKPFKVVIMHYQNDRKMDSFSQTMLNHKSFEKRIIVKWFDVKFFIDQLRKIPLRELYFQHDTKQVLTDIPQICQKKQVLTAKILFKPKKNPTYHITFTNISVSFRLTEKIPRQFF